ncbi:hypothetical protein [Marinobacter salexigens]|uniref:hypothetical protein n=1 Tax=Marinobacter salexigens TaxID=1925763 RepID=UPI000C288E0F|nr:hypothetical protein [Marinobacter salexigens]
MNLEDFIAQSLSQIAKGIDKANEELSDSLAVVSPRGVKDVHRESRYGSLKVGEGTWLKVHEINFDVAVTAAEGSEARGGLGITVGAVTLGASGKENYTNTSVSRIQFSVPMVLPQAEPKI